MRHRWSQRGSVLIVILWISLGLVSVTLLFGHAMMLAFRGADNEVAAGQAEEAIEGAARYAMYLLANPEEPGQLPLPETYVREQVPVGEAQFWLLGRPVEAMTGSEPVFGWIDEASKLNLNTASQSMFEGLPGMTAELAAAIVDWRDADDEVSAGGAETETYQMRRPASGCKNGPFETVEELALLNGATAEVLYGEDANRNGILDPNENDGERSAPPDNGDGRLDPGVVDYLTVYSREPNTRSDGSARINVGQSTQELGSLLNETFGEQRASEIQGRLGGAGNLRSLLELFVRSGMSSDEFDQIAGELTVTNADFMTGLVNVNTASEAVLACVPGIDESKAAELVATRLSRATPARSVAWVAEVLGEENAIQAGSYLTGQSWQVSADIAAVGRYGRGYRRTLMVIDGSGEEPAIVYRRNLSGLGWALGSRVMQALDAADGVGTVAQRVR